MSFVRFANEYVGVSPSGSSADAFGRQRVSSTGQRLDVEFIYDKQDSFFDEITNNGTVTHNGNTRDLTLSLSDANNGSSAEMRSHPIPYTPGNSQLAELTGVLDDSNIGGGNCEVFLRSKITGTVTEEVTPQTEWDYTGTIHWNESHIFHIDFQSLKVGTIRYNLVRSGQIVNVHTIHNDDIRNSGYWQLPSLPIYYRLYNDATYTYMEVGYGNTDNAVGFRYKILANASATMKAICCTVKSEGGLDLRDMQGLPASIDSGVTAKTVSTTLIPILSIRPRTTFKTYDNLAIALPKSFTVATDNPIKLVVLHDTTLTGASWANVNTNDSMMEYDTSATAITGTHAIYSDYINTTAKNAGNASQGILGKTVMWNRKGSASGIITIAAVRTSTTNSLVLASINWEEIR